MDQIIFNLLSSCLSNDTQLIQNSEMEINSLLSKDYLSIILYLTAFIQNEGIQKNIRKMGILIFKNSLNKEEYSKLWISSIDERKDQIKANLFSTLGTNDYDILKVICTGIAQLAKLEFSCGKWKEILSYLENVLNNSDMNFKYACLLCLEFLLQEVNIGDLNENDVKFLLNTIICQYDAIYIIEEQVYKNNLTKKIVLSQLIKVLFELIKFCKCLFSDTLSQDKFFFELNKIWIKERLSIETTKNFITILEVIFENFYYSIIPNNITDMLSEVTNDCFNSKEFELIEEICNLWNIISIFEIKNTTQKDYNIFYSSRNRKFCLGFSSILLNHIIQSLLLNNTIKFTLDISNDWNYVNSIISLILSLSQCCPLEFIKNLYYSFIIKYYSDENIYYKERAILAYASILESEISRHFLNDSIERIVDEFLIQINNPFLRCSIGYTIEKTFASYGSSFIKKGKKETNLIILKLLSLIKEYINKDQIFTIRIINSTISIVDSISKPDFLLLEYKTIEELFQLGFSPGVYDYDKEVTFSIIILIGVIIKNLNEECFISLNSLYHITIEKFHQVNNFLLNKDNKENYYKDWEFAFQSELYLCKLLQYFISNKCHLKLGEIEFNEVMSLAITTSQIQNKVTEEVISLFYLMLDNDNTSLFFQKNLSHLVNYIYIGLELYDDFNLCKESLNCGDLLTRILSTNENEDVIRNLIKRFLNIIKANLNENQRILKTISLEIIGSYYISFSSIVHDYFNEIMEIIQYGMQTCILHEKEFNDEDDELEMVQYQIKLGNSIVVCLNLMMKELQTHNLLSKYFNSHVENICSFMNQIGKKEEVDEETISNLLWFYIDIIIEYKVSVYYLIDKSLVKKLLDKVNSGKGNIQLVNYAMKNIRHFLNS